MESSLLDEIHVELGIWAEMLTWTGAVAIVASEVRHLALSGEVSLAAGASGLAVLMAVWFLLIQYCPLLRAHNWILHSLGLEAPGDLQEDHERD